MTENSENIVGTVRRLDPTIGVRLGHAVLNWTAAKLNRAFFEATARLCDRVGHYGLLLAVVLGVVYAVVAAIKTNAASYIFYGIGWIPVVWILQYTAAKFASAGQEIIAATPSQLSSAAFLRCWALLHFGAGILALIGYTVVAIRTEVWNPFWFGLGVFAFCLFIVSLCLDPELLNISISSASSPAQEALGILTFFLKAPLRLVPIAFVIGVLLGAIMLGVSIFYALKEGLHHPQAQATNPAMLILMSAALPFFGYLTFLLLNLGLEVCRAILAVPAKLDGLRQK